MQNKELSVLIISIDSSKKSFKLIFFAVEFFQSDFAKARLLGNS